MLVKTSTFTWKLQVSTPHVFMARINFIIYQSTIWVDTLILITINFNTNGGVPYKQQMKYMD